MKNLRKFMKTITCCMLSIVLCFSSSGSSFFTLKAEAAAVAAGGAAATVFDWFLTLLAAAGFAYTSDTLAQSDFADYLRSLEADINVAANASSIAELQEKIPWLNFDEENDTVAAINEQLGYMHKSLTSGKDSAAEAYPDVDKSKADKNNIIKMSDWIKNKRGGNPLIPLGPIGQAIVTVKPSPGVELTDRVAVFLSENWPASLPVYGSMKPFFNFLEQHKDEYVSSEASRFFVSIAKSTSSSDPNIVIRVVELPNDVRYLRISDFQYSVDAVFFKPVLWNLKTNAFVLNPDSYFAFGNAFDFSGFNIDNVSLHGNILDDSSDGYIFLFSSLDNLFLLDAAGDNFAEAGDVVKISDSISDTVPSEAVNSQKLIDAVNAALEAGKINKDYDFSAVLSMISAGNEQQHEDNDKQLGQLTLIASLFSGLNDFLQENAKQAALDLDKINISLNNAGKSVVDAVLNIDFSDIVNALNSIDMGTLALINTGVSDISLSIPNAVDSLKAAMENLPIGDIANDIASIGATLKIDITGAFNTLQQGISADIRILSDDINQALEGLGINALGVNISALLSQILGKVSSMDSTINNSFDEFDSGGKGFNLLNLLHAIFMILFLLLKIFIDCLVFITLIFNIKAEPYFLNDYMVQGLEFLKTTEISGFGISIHAFLMNLLSIVVIFAVVGSLKRHIHRMKIK